MQITNTTFDGRRAWRLDNDALAVHVLAGGGHIASLALADEPGFSPLWRPVWRTREPWQVARRGQAAPEARLLASLCGHNLCLGCFGGPSDEEFRAGATCHGEAPVVRWSLLRKSVGRRRVALTCGCELPAAGMRFERSLSARRGAAVVHVREEITSLSRCDAPFTMCQHVTLGPPFLEKGVTVFDMPAKQAHTFPGAFSDRQRLKPDTAFTWPLAPGAKGERVDLRRIDKRYRVSSDFSTQLIDPARETGWFAALHPPRRLLLAYVWRRADFPWVGNWEENYGRKTAPWDGRSLARGMEFANSPFPASLREQVDRGTFQGRRTYRWLPARGRIRIDYDIVLLRTPANAAGLDEIHVAGDSARVKLRF
jgi:hypothetical protein